MAYSDGLDNGAFKHFLTFNSSGLGKKYIVEPVGFDASDLVFKQESGRYGRDVSFAGGESEFTFMANVEHRGLTHEFDEIISNNNTYGYESDVKYGLEYNGSEYVLGELDFEFKKTDGIFYFTCKVIQDTLEATIKRHQKTNVNVFSDTDINGTPITPLSPELVVFKSTPVKRVSEWTISEPIPPTEASNVVGTSVVYASFTPVINQSEINDTLPPSFFFSSTESAREDATYIRAVDVSNDFVNLDNFVINIDNFTYNFSGRLATSGDSFPIQTTVLIRIGLDFDNPRLTSGFNIANNGTGISLESPTLNLERGETVWMWFRIESTSNDNLLYTYSVDSLDISASAIETSIDTVTESLRLIDVMKQVVTSTSGASVDAPEFEQGGELYSNFLVNGNQLRNIQDRDFNISFEDILKGIKEFDADYEVQPDGTIYFGTRDTFYKDVSIDTFTLKPNNVYEEYFNPRHTINTLEISYDNYEQGENEASENSKEGIHTEAQYNLPNQRVENEKSISLPWGRDPFLIDKVRRQGLAVPDETSQEDDETKFIVDVEEAEGDITINQTFFLNQIVVSELTLQLVNDNSFNWQVSGMQVNDVITITGSNAGNFNVLAIEPTYLLLSQSPVTTPITTGGYEQIDITYNITSTNLVSATNEDFTTIIGSTEPEGFANMSYSIARNIRRFFGSYLKTATKYYPTGSLINTKFIHNSDFTTRKVGETVDIIEGSDISVTDLESAILTNTIIETQVPCSIIRYMNLVTNLRTQRGYISVTDNLGNINKIHPQEMSLELKRNLLTIKGEKRV